jgi:hypothetical protein
MKKKLPSLLATSQSVRNSNTWEAKINLLDAISSLAHFRQTRRNTVNDPDDNVLRMSWIPTVKSLTKYPKPTDRLLLHDPVI